MSDGVDIADVSQGPLGLSVIVPARDEEPHLRDVVDDVVIALASSGREFEVIVVDHASVDGTGLVADALARDHHSVRVVRIGPEGGKGAALAAGFDVAAYPLLAFIDADGQIASTHLVDVLESAGPGVIVCGRRTGRRMTMSRRVLSAGYRVAVRALVGVSVADVGCPLKVFPAALVVPALLSTRWVVDAELVARARSRGLGVIEVDVPVVQGDNDHASTVKFWPALVSGVRELLRLRRQGAR